MASNGDFTRSVFGGVLDIIYDPSVVSLGGMSRSLFGGIPPLIGPSVGGEPPAEGPTGMIMVSGTWVDIASAKVMVSGAWVGVTTITVKA